MESLLTDYTNIIQKIDLYEKEEDISEEVKKEIIKYQDDFMTLNIQVQNLRSQNENLLDEIEFKNKKIKDLDKDIDQKGNLIRFLDDKLKKK